MSLLCSYSYQQDIPGCVDSINFELPLEPSEEYLIVFEFANGYTFRKTITTGYNGMFSLDRNADVDGFWNEGTGSVLMSVYTGNACDPVSFEICGSTYSVIELNFQSIETDEAEVTVPCTCDE